MIGVRESDFGVWSSWEYVETVKDWHRFSQGLLREGCQAGQNVRTSSQALMVTWVVPKLGSPYTPFHKDAKVGTIK